MEGYLQSFIKEKNKIHQVEIFSYATNGIPGVELHGLGKHSKKIKEKIIFLTRKRKLRAPFKRYVICITSESEILYSKAIKFEYLELPILIMYWSMAGFIKIHNLSEILINGKISPKGIISQYKMDQDLLSYFDKNHDLKKILYGGKFFHERMKGLLGDEVDVLKEQFPLSFFGNNFRSC